VIASRRSTLARASAFALAGATALLLLPALGTGCGQTVSLGVADGGPGGSTSVGSSATGLVGCEGRLCGDPCPLTACTPGTEDCDAVPDVAGYCSVDGLCSATYPKCGPDDPCLGLACGEACFVPCPEGQGCPEPYPPYTCDAFGECRPDGYLECCKDGFCPYNPCIDLGLQCGEPCNPCPPGQACPPSNAVCDLYGNCIEAEVVDCPPPMVLCDDGSTCGDYCQPCPPGDGGCDPYQVYVCDVAHECAPYELVYCTAPCDPGLACGTPCSLCPSDQPDCPPPSGEYVCDLYATCTPFEFVSCWDPCPGLDASCGQPCLDCDPSLPGCVPTDGAYCDLYGSCTYPAMSCYQPCLGKICGEDCSPCDPQDAGCMAMPGLAHCDDFGGCYEGDIFCE
jgi:hypothetical protein